MARTGVLLGLVFFAFTSCRNGGHPRLLHEDTSPFAQLVVREESPGVRTLQFGRDGVIQSRVNVDDPLDLRLAYTRGTLVAWSAVPEPAHVLIIGLGGGALPRFFHRTLPGTQLDVAELDPKVAEVAKRYFDLPDDERLRVHIGDGRKYVEQATTKWDLIVLDAYGDSDIPRHLTTAEFLTTVKAHLNAHGVVAGNVWARAHNPLYDAMARTWSDAFAKLCIVEVEGSGNRIFIASQDVDVSAAALRAAAAKLHTSFDVAAYAPAECASDMNAAPPLND